MAGTKTHSQNRGQLRSNAQSHNSTYSPSAAALVYPDKVGHPSPMPAARKIRRGRPHGESMRYEKSETILRIALDMQGSAGGLSLEDIRKSYSEKPLSRRTAERLRDAIERLFPQLDQVNPGEFPKRWRLPGGSTAALANITADELADLAIAVSLLRRENMNAQADSTERAISKIRALSKRPVITRIRA